MFFSKKSLLGGILASRFGNRGPPLPPFGKTSQKIPYFIFKSDHGDNKWVPLIDDKVKHLADEQTVLSIDRGYMYTTTKRSKYAGKLTWYANIEF